MHVKDSKKHSEFKKITGNILIENIEITNPE